MDRRQVLSRTAAGVAVASLPPAISVGAEATQTETVIGAEKVISHGWRVGTPLAIAMEQLSPLLPPSIVASAAAGLIGDFGPDEPVTTLRHGVSVTDRATAYAAWRRDTAQHHGKVLMDVAWLPAARPLWIDDLGPSGRPGRVAAPAGLHSYLNMTCGEASVVVDENADADARVGTLVPDDLPDMERRASAVALDGVLPPLTPVWLAVTSEVWNAASKREQAHTRAAVASVGERLAAGLLLHNRMARHILEERQTVRVVNFG